MGPLFTSYLDVRVFPLHRILTFMKKLRTRLHLDLYEMSIKRDGEKKEKKKKRDKSYFNVF